MGSIIFLNVAIKYSLLGGILFSLIIWLKRLQKRSGSISPFPPGPKPWPIIGNLRDIPAEYEWLTVAEWTKTYGDIVHVELLGTRIYYLNTLSAAQELFEKRSALYSDRAILTMACELIGWSRGLGFMPYGARWRKVRRAFHQHFRYEASQNFRPSQLLEARKMLVKLLETPERFCEHVRHASGATIVLVTYGIEVEESDDVYIKHAESAMKTLSETYKPGAFLVDIVPMMKHLPEWFPGAGFIKLAKEWKKEHDAFFNEPFRVTKEIMANSKVGHSVMGDMLQRFKPGQDINEEEEIIKDVAGSAYAAGSDTTVSSIQFLFLALLLHPEVQKKAQEELDRVIGNDRLPDFSDQPFLPYINAISKELLRWHPVVPMGIPHTVTKDDEFQGYFVPKGTIVSPNAWAMLHDPVAYVDPMRFNPERFLNVEGQLDPSVQDPALMCFGFGRRICPGRHMAVNTIFIAVASILATLRIEHAVDEAGQRIEVQDEVTSGFLSFPKPFQCSIKPRFPETPTLIQRALKERQGTA